jgi:2-dehydro-3-deoxygluconokinase
MLDVVTIGDAMITLNPTTKGPLRYVHTFERKVGGAELNLAIGCARLGLKTGMISRIGNDEFGKYIFNFIRGEGIDTSQIKMVEYPTSLNIKEIFEDGSGRTFYYRENSPILSLTPEDIPEDYIKNTKILHISGVFSSIHPKNEEIIHHALILAKKHQVLVSLDPNIRLKMWSKEKAKEVLTNYLPYVDILLTGEEEAYLLFGTKDSNQIIDICKTYGIETIAIKKGEKGATAYHKGEYLDTPAYQPIKVVDTVGAGDGFDTGFLYGLLNNLTLERTLQISNMIGSMVVSVSGDNEGLPYLDEVLFRLGEKEFIER